MTRRRFAWIAPALAALAVVVVFVVVLAAGDDDATPATTTTSAAPTSTEPTTTTTTTRPPAVPVETIAVEPFAVDAPTSYRISYDIVENQLPRTETVTVRRPYESLVISQRDGEQIGGTATSRTRLWTYLTDRAGWLSIQPELHRAAFDNRPLRAMAAAIALGRAEETGTDSVLGIACRVFRTGQPLGSTGVTAPSEEESTELCIDDRGLVLREVWQIGGTTVVERTATSVEVDVGVDAGVFDPTPILDDAEEFEALMSSIAVPADEATLAALQTDVVPPPGYQLDGSVLRAGRPDGSAPSSAEIVRFYSNGTDLIEVAELTSSTPVDLSTGGAVPVEIEGPETWFVPDFRASAIRTRLSESSYLEMRGPDPSVLVAMLDTLTRRSG